MQHTAHAEKGASESIGPPPKLFVRTTLAQELDFYEQYEWCINPLRTIGDFLLFIPTELERLRSATVSWQREEHRKNIYLFACAISATVADYLAPSTPNLTRVGGTGGSLRLLLDTASYLLQMGCRIKNRLLDVDLASWVAAWNTNVEQICHLLVSGDQRDDRLLDSIAAATRTLSAAGLPVNVLKLRESLPFGLREQDSSHQDVVTLARAFMASHSPQTQPILVVGLRTAGTFFAPIVRECLTQSQSASVSWVTVRPRSGISAWELSAIREARHRKAHVVIVDDHPDSGETLALTLAILRKEGIALSETTILVPAHPAQRKASALRGWQPDVNLIKLDPAETFKSQFLATDAPSVIRAYYLREGWNDVVVGECSDPVAVQLKDRSSDFHVRLKRLYEVSLSSDDSLTTNTHRVLAKDVGYGWLGYHAYLAGTRLRPGVPRVLGLREGFLFSEWIDDDSNNCFKPPISVISSYITRRVASLRLQEDPCYDSNCYGNSAWYFLSKNLRGVYGPFVSHLKARPLRTELRTYLTAIPTFIDANLRPEEWVSDKKNWFKLDYEHDGFGNPGLNLNLVDPVYDLASAIFEFDLGVDEEKQLVTEYVDQTGDLTAGRRLVIHKLLYGMVASKAAQTRRMRARSRPERLFANAREFAARDFLVANLSQFCGERLRACFKPIWTDKVFITDLDGVFDRNLLCFPHPTLASLESLALLLTNAYSVVANTGRSVYHARAYCMAYPFSGVVAEHGTIFVDAVNHREVCPVSPNESAQLQIVRERINASDDLLMDPKYECAINVHTYRDAQNISPLPANTAQALLDGCPDLRFVSNSTETFILPKLADKTWGLRALLNHSGIRAVTAAIGDSDFDVDLLKFVDHPYAPANLSAGLRQLAASRQCRAMQEPFQRGLLHAVQDLLVRIGGLRKNVDESCYRPNDHLLTKLLRAADHTPFETALSAVQFWKL